jgi:hypothetical protein
MAHMPEICSLIVSTNSDFVWMVRSSLSSTKKSITVNGCAFAKNKNVKCEQLKKIKTRLIFALNSKEKVVFKRQMIEKEDEAGPGPSE